MNTDEEEGPWEEHQNPDFSENLLEEEESEEEGEWLEESAEDEPEEPAGSRHSPRRAPAARPSPPEVGRAASRGRAARAHAASRGRAAHAEQEHEDGRAYPNPREASRVAARRGSTRRQREAGLTGLEAPFSTLSLRRSADPVLSMAWELHGWMVTLKWKMLVWLARARAA